MRGGSVGTSIRGPESQEVAYKYVKGPIALAIDGFCFVLFFLLFFLCVNYFQLFLVYLEKYLCKIHLTSEFWLLIITHIYRCMSFVQNLKIYPARQNLYGFLQTKTYQTSYVSLNFVT